MQRKLGVKATNRDSQLELVQQGTSAVNLDSEIACPSSAEWVGLGDVDQARQALSRFADYAYRRYMEGSPRTDLLLTLIKFNVFRALMANDQALGFANQWLDWEAISPFFHANNRRCAATEQTCPANLMPTDVQLIVEHHPWIDLLPDPKMRTNILLLGDDYDDTPLCHDIVDDRHARQSESLIVWGDPCDPESWEIGEDFSRKWATIVQGCHRLFKATNNWRVRRGEPKLFPDALCLP